MSHFECKLPIDQMFNFLNKPRNLDKEEFICIMAHMGLNIEKFTQRILEDDNNNLPHIFDILHKLEWVQSKRELRDLIKANSLFFGSQQVKNENFDIKTATFFDTGVKNEWGELKFTIIRISKKQHEIVFTYEG